MGPSPLVKWPPVSCAGCSLRLSKERYLVTLCTCAQRLQLHSPHRPSTRWQEPNFPIMDYLFQEFVTITQLDWNSRVVQSQPIGAGLTLCKVCVDIRGVDVGGEVFQGRERLVQPSIHRLPLQGQVGSAKQNGRSHPN